MNDFFQIFEFIYAYIDELLISTKGYWIDNLHKLELTLNQLKEIEPKCNIVRSFFRKIKMEYLGLWETRDGLKLIDKK